MYRTSYRKPLQRPPSPPCSSTAWSRPDTALLVCRCKSDAPACHRGAGWTFSRIGRISPLAALCSPWCSCTSWPSLDESSSPTRKSSLARSGSCFSTGKGKMLENFSQYLWTSVLHLNLDLSRNVVAILLGGSRTYDLFLTVAIVLGRLLPLAIELDGIRTCDIVNGLLFHITVRCLHVTALVIILRGGVNVVGGVAHPVLPC